MGSAEGLLAEGEGEAALYSVSTPHSGTAARQLIREPSSCPAFQAVNSSHPSARGGMGGKAQEHRVRDHSLRCRGCGQAVRIGSGGRGRTPGSGLKKLGGGRKKKDYQDRVVCR